jgi:hypothetical protein
MKVIPLKEITNKTSTRDDGTEAAIQLIDDLHQYGPTVVPGESEWIYPNVIEVRIEWNGLIVEIPEDVHVSSSFIDEIIYRLDEKGILKDFAFALFNEKTYDKFQTVSDNREIEINVMWNDKRKTIKPSDKPSKAKHKIIHRDL